MDIISRAANVVNMGVGVGLVYELPFLTQNGAWLSFVLLFGANSLAIVYALFNIISLPFRQCLAKYSYEARLRKAASDAEKAAADAAGAEGGGDVALQENALMVEEGGAQTARQGVGLVVGVGLGTALTVAEYVPVSNKKKDRKPEHRQNMRSHDSDDEEESESKPRTERLASDALKAKWMAMFEEDDDDVTAREGPTRVVARPTSDISSRGQHTGETDPYAAAPAAQKKAAAPPPPQQQSVWA